MLFTRVFKIGAMHVDVKYWRQYLANGRHVANSLLLRQGLSEDAAEASIIAREH